MQGAVLYAPRDIRSEERPEPKILQPTDASFAADAANVNRDQPSPWLAMRRSAFSVSSPRSNLLVYRQDRLRLKRFGRKKMKVGVQMDEEVKSTLIGGA